MSKIYQKKSLFIYSVYAFTMPSSAAIYDPSDRRCRWIDSFNMTGISDLQFFGRITEANAIFRCETRLEETIH